jgi:hypothetical protein
MNKYIYELGNEFKSRRIGIQKNSALWASLPANEETTVEAQAALTAIDEEIEAAKTKVTQLQKQAHTLEAELKKKLAQIDSLAAGLHNNDATKLLDYGIVPRKTPSPKAIPLKGMIKGILDDFDGEGFILERDTLVDANNYEWQKAQGEDPTVTIIDESNFTHFKITKKRTFVDDDVKKGVRYFYRFRAFNSLGNGPWSESVSRSQ